MPIWFKVWGFTWLQGLGGLPLLRFEGLDGLHVFKVEAFERVQSAVCFA